MNGGDRVERGEGRSGADLGGKKREAQRPRGERGRVGERPEEARGLASLSSPSPARGCGGDGPCSNPGRGNREGEGEWERWARPAGPGVGPVGPGVQWGVFSFSFFLFLCLFCFLLYFLFIYLFSFLFYFI